MSWVTSVFDTPQDLPRNASGSVTCPPFTGISVKRRRKLGRSLWADEYAPQCLEHLAVHVKKIRELEIWLNTALHGNLGPGPVALLVGPSGCGKSATLRVVAKSLNCTLKEWINPTSNATLAGAIGQELLRNNNQVENFEDFLFRASRYQDLFMEENSRTLLLVEDIPNVFIREHYLMEKTLRKYAEVGKCPLVFIVPNGSAEHSFERDLFKPQIISELGVNYISFNSINKTLMTKALERILNHASEDYPLISPRGNVNVEETVSASNGDIRFAVNYLQFRIMGEKAPLQCFAPPNRQPKRVTREPTMATKDRTVDLFRCLGKVLYNKKETISDVETGTTSLKPVHDPEEISSKMSSVPKLFLGLLTENYPHVMTDVKHIAEAANLLSMCDVMMSCYTADGDKDLYKMYAVNVAVNGLMNLPPTVAQRKFLPFRGSKMKEVQALVKERVKKCKDLFPLSHFQPQTWLTEVFPLMKTLDIGALSAEQEEFLREMNRFKSTRPRLKLSQSDCKDGSTNTASTPDEAIAEAERPSHQTAKEMNATSFDENDCIVIDDSSDDEKGCV